MKSHFYRISRKGFYLASICSFLGMSMTTPRNTMAQTSGYICGDFHQHTTFTDGSYSFDYVMAKNNEFGLDWWANSEHGGYFDRDGRYTGIDLNTTVFWDTQESIDIFGDIIYRGPHQAMWRWQILKNYSFKSLLKARHIYPDKVIIQGFEWNMPGYEHSSVGLITAQFGEYANANALAEFEYRFDNRDNDQSGGAAFGWKKSKLSGHDKMLEAIAWLQKYHQYQSWVIPAHPERNGIYGINHFRDMNNAGPDVCFGFESMPGHQKSSKRGSYRSTSDGGGTYGGCGDYAAKIGGLWDAMLSEGRNWWLFANSDFHNLKSCFWPGEYQKTYIWASNKKSPQAIVNGLRSGNSWVVEGDLIDELYFRIVSKNKRHGVWATMGQTLYLNNDYAIVKIIVNDPNDTNNFGNNPELDHIDLIMGEVTGFISPGEDSYYKDEVATTKVIARFDATGGEKDENGIVSIAWRTNNNGKIMVIYEVRDIKSACYFRLRGTNKGLNEHYETDAYGNPLLDRLNQNTFEIATTDLWFYSNPIFVEPAGRNQTNHDLSSNTGTGEIEPIYSPDFKLFPNPAEQHITITNPGSHKIEVTLRDGSGKSYKTIITSGNLAQIDISELPTGLFFVTIKSCKGVKTIKLSKK